MDETQNTSPTLTVIAGGKDKPGKCKRSGKAPSGLTVKQEAYCQRLAEGLSATEAYRLAYDASGMKANVVNNEAWRLSARPDIAKRTADLIAEKQARNSIFTERQKEKNSDRIWARLWAMVDDVETPPAVKASLLSLGAKAAGMLTDRVETRIETADSKSIESELIERLQRLRAS